MTKGAKLFICNLADLFAARDQAIACERYIDAAELPVGERDAVEIVAYGLAVLSASQAVFDDLGYLIESLKATERADKKKVRLGRCDGNVEKPMQLG